MACYKPLKGYKSPSGKIVFDRKGSIGRLAECPCGQCIGCRLDYAQEWAIRCLHESETHSANSFITLTYDTEHLPHNGSLDKTHFQKFIKRFRERISPQKIRFYHCGEYGPKYSRPHYHSLIFGYDFPDKSLWSYGQGKDPLYRSALLESLWDKGHSSIGNVTYASAGYCARYTIKKVRGQALQTRDPETDLLPYQKFSELTGEVIDLEPEYATMSRNPGIARDWYEKYKSDVFPDDFCVYKGRKVRTPNYYRRILAVDDVALADQLRASRIQKASSERAREDATRARLEVREKVKRAQINTLNRDFENGTSAF